MILYIIRVPQCKSLSLVLNLGSIVVSHRVLCSIGLGNATDRLTLQREV